MMGKIGSQYAGSPRDLRSLGAVMAAGDLDDGPIGELGSDALRRLASLGLSSACLTHDMGNLLQVISSALRLIERRQEAKPLDVQALCSEALAAVERIVSLRRQVLALARVEPAVMSRVNPAAVVSSLRGLIALTLGSDISFEVACEDDAPEVACDVQELENAIFNLVLNARDAMPSGGCLTISLARGHGGWGDAGEVVAQAQAAVLRVSDTGCGMSPAVLSQVFTPFFTTKSSDRGTGLGLPMVREFTRRAGGSVEIGSEPGIGTTVVLTLPSA